MPLRKVARPLLIGLCLCLSWVASAQSDPNAVMATVNGDEIKAQEYWHRLVWYKVDPSSPLSNLPVGFLTLNQLITERLVFQMARDKDVSPSQQQVEDQMKTEETTDPNILQELKDQGRPESDLYDDVKYQLAQYNLRTYGITITDQEVEQHYKDYPSEYSIPKQFKLKVIAVQDDSEASAVDKELAAGTDFGKVAREHSLDITKDQDGEFGLVPVTSLKDSTLRALEAIKIGDQTPWVSGGQDSVIRVKYLVEDIVPSKVQPLDDALRHTIRRTLAIGKGDVRNSVFKDLEAATLVAKVAIAQPGLQKIYDQVITKYKQAHPTPAKG